jgi:hypothetical protein
MRFIKPAAVTLATVVLCACNLKVVNSGGGSVASESGTIDCGSACTVSHNSTTAVTEVLTATPDTANGYRFERWTGPCLEADLTQPTCSVSISAYSGNKTVQALFSKSAGYEVGSFHAEYFNKGISVTSAEVASPAIHYIYSDFHGIRSEDFSAVWTGTLEVFDDSKDIDLNFDVSWSDVALTIDGLSVATWSNDSRTIRHTFAKGLHDIRIEYSNNWHTTGFNVSFSDNAEYSASQLAQLIGIGFPNDVNVVYLGGYESGNLHNDVTVSLAGVTGRVFLFLATFRAVNWIIENPDNVEIVGIGYNSSQPESSMVVAEGVKTYEITNLPYSYNSVSNANQVVAGIVGRSPNQSFATYTLHSIALGAISN